MGEHYKASKIADYNLDLSSTPYFTSVRVLSRESSRRVILMLRLGLVVAIVGVSTSWLDKVVSR